MSKYIKHNFNKDDSGENNETPRNKDPKIVSIDSLKEKYATEVALTIAPEILEFTKITADILEDEFDHDCTINRREVDGNYRLYVTKKGVEQKSEGQLLVTVTKNHTYNIRLNPYSKYEKHYFLAQNMDTKKLINEIPTIKGFLSNEKVPDQSVFKKEVYSRKAA